MEQTRMVCLTAKVTLGSAVAYGEGMNYGWISMAKSPSHCSTEEEYGTLYSSTSRSEKAQA
jgi:hypothetical protein